MVPSSPLLDVSLRPAYPAAYRVWVDHGPEVRQLMRDWYTESRGHGPADSDIDHMIWRLLNEPERWGTLRAAMQSSWPIEGQEPIPVPEPSPGPVPPAPPPSTLDPRETPDRVMENYVRVPGEASQYWPAAKAGDAVSAHRVTREVAAQFAAIDPRWGLITKQAGQQQCTWEACGPTVQGGYGEDVIAFLPGTDRDVWIGYDIVGGAGAPGARLQYVGPVPIRPGNQWAPVPPLP